MLTARVRNRGSVCFWPGARKQLRRHLEVRYASLWSQDNSDARIRPFECVPWAAFWVDDLPRLERHPFPLCHCCTAAHAASGEEDPSDYGAAHSERNSRRSQSPGTIQICICSLDVISTVTVRATGEEFTIMIWQIARFGRTSFAVPFGICDWLAGLDP